MTKAKNCGSIEGANFPWVFKAEDPENQPRVVLGAEHKLRPGETACFASGLAC